MRLEDVLILGGIFGGKYSAIEEVKIISDGQIGLPRDVKTFQLWYIRGENWFYKSNKYTSKILQEGSLIITLTNLVDG